MQKDSLLIYIITFVFPLNKCYKLYGSTCYWIESIFFLIYELIFLFLRYKTWLYGFVLYVVLKKSVNLIERKNTKQALRNLFWLVFFLRNLIIHACFPTMIANHLLLINNLKSAFQWKSSKYLHFGYWFLRRFFKTHMYQFHQFLDYRLKKQKCFDSFFMNILFILECFISCLVEICNVF